MVSYEPGREIEKDFFSSYHERDLVELLPKEYIPNDKFNRKKGFYQYCMMQCYIKLYVTFKRGHQEGNFKCIDIFNLTSRRLKKNTNLRQPRLSKKPVMVYRGRGRVGGFFHMVFRGGWRGISRCKQSIQGSKRKLTGN